MIKVIIITTGLPGAGKGTLAEVAKELGIPVLVMGDVIREEVRAQKLEPTPENMRRISKELREKEGMDVVARRMLNKLENVTSCAVLIDGVRSMCEVNVFKKVAKVIIIKIDAPFEVRLERIKKRGRSDDKPEDLKKREQMELAFGMKEVMEKANYTLENVGSLDDFKDEARRLLLRILKEHCPSLLATQ